METKSIAELKDIQLSTDENQEVQVAKNVIELISKLEELDKLFEEIEWVEMQKKGKIVWFSMELDMLLTKNPKEIIKEIDHDLVNPKTKKNYKNDNDTNKAKEKIDVINEDDVVWEVLFDKVGYKYWNNKLLGNKPMKTQQPTTSARVRHNLSTVDGDDPWIECYDEYNESKYWYNQETGQSYYDDNYPSTHR